MCISDLSSDVCSSDLFHHLIDLLDYGFDHLLAIFGGLVGHVGGDLDIIELRAQAFILPYDAAIVDEVHNTLEAAFRTDREVKHQRFRAKAIDDRLHAVLEIGTSAVQLVDEAHSWHAVLVGLAPHGLGLSPHPVAACDPRHRPLAHAPPPHAPARAVDV